MKVLILSAYNAVSHHSLNTGLIKYLGDIDFTLLTLPPRYFAWRTRGNSLSFAFEQREALTKGYDLIFATSFTDITGLRGLVPELAGIPLAVYFHENQFAYPDSRSAHGSLETKIVSVYNALAADRVVFNTDFNKNTFLAGAEALLKKMPDHVPPGLTDMIRDKSSVIHVPIEKRKIPPKHPERPSILWNHRWEYDKGPDRFLEVLRELKRRNFDFTLNMAGQVFRETPEAFDDIRKEFAEIIRHWGFAESRAAYDSLMAESSFVVSTAVHDFQGLSVMEAAEAGCVPVLPRRLAYPELFAPEYFYETADEISVEAENCAEHIINLSKNVCAPDMSKYYWENLIGDYRHLFELTVSSACHR